MDESHDTTTIVESEVTSVSWIPSEAVTGLSKVLFAVGTAHYDDPPPDRLGSLAEWRDEDRFRFANHLRARIEVQAGPDGPVVVGAEYVGGSLIGSTTVRAVGRDVTFAAVALEELRVEPEVLGDRVRFVQTFGGRTALPAPRRVDGAPFVQLTAPLVWTTLALTLHVDGSATHEVVGASPFPRHWIYGADGELVQKVGRADFEDWYRHSFGRHSPWGDEESPALVTEVESALERRLSTLVMRGGTRPRVRTADAGSLLFRQGEPGGELHLLLDGVVAVEVDATVVAEVGPGAILGERAIVESGRSTSTVRAVTACRVAVATTDQIDHDHLVELSRSHRREERPTPTGAG
ncbi:MAG: cyclic nucleotide-binding domain-containing protein [Acidimicrobiales bacterium]|nr:cyclic nucleotide-binding domain-containing protein [Actinomycetota bacterium]